MKQLFYSCYIRHILHALLYIQSSYIQLVLRTNIVIIFLYTFRCKSLSRLIWAQAIVTASLNLQMCAGFPSIFLHRKARNIFCILFTQIPYNSEVRRIQNHDCLLEMRQVKRIFIMAPKYLACEFSLSVSSSTYNTSTCNNGQFREI